MTNQTPLAVSISQAARLTSLSRAMLRGYINNGRLHSVKIGRRTLIPYAGLVRFIERGITEGCRGAKQL